MMHHEFNIQQLYALPTLYLYVLYLSEEKNSDLCHLQHKLIGFYNRDEKCLLRGTDWAFKWSSLRFVFKRLKHDLQPAATFLNYVYTIKIQLNQPTRCSN